MKRLPPKNWDIFLVCSCNRDGGAPTHITNFQDPDSLDFSGILPMSAGKLKTYPVVRTPATGGLAAAVVLPQNQDKRPLKPLSLKPRCVPRTPLLQESAGLLYVRKENGTLQLLQKLTITMRCGAHLPRHLIYNPLFLPMIFNGKVFPEICHSIRRKRKQHRVTHLFQ